MPLEVARAAPPPTPLTPLGPEACERLQAAASAIAAPPRRAGIDLPDAGELDRWLAWLVDPGFRLADARPTWQPARQISPYYVAHRFDDFVALPELGSAHLVRLLALLGLLDSDPRRPQFSFDGLTALLAIHALAHGGADLLQIAVDVAAIGGDPELLGEAMIYAWTGSPWRGTAVPLPYFAAHARALESALGVGSASVPSSGPMLQDPRRAALEVLAELPAPPPSLVEPLWEIGLGSARGEQPFAWSALARVPGTRERLLAALADRKAPTREAAADWLATLADSAAVPAIEKALRKERGERVKAALMGALEALGASVDVFLDRDGLAGEAGKGLAKGVPPGLAWIPFDRLPALSWADDGAPVERAIVSWWLVQAAKLGAPEAGPLLRRYAARTRPAEARAFGLAVLEAWIGHDSRPPGEDERQARLQELLAQRWYTPEQAAAIAASPNASAIGDKGVLAVAGAFGGAALVPPIAAYLKTWYGMRAAQCKAMLAMLAWVEAPAAVQLLLATATRFRTPGIRKLAAELVDEVAARRGWSVEDLADRTVPSAELDDDGTMTLDFGARRFRVHLSDELELVLEDGDGKRLAGLPEPRQDDDAEAAAAAKARLSAAKKQLKTLAKQQGERLYEAMCSGRRWPVDDWRRYFLAHPVMARLCARLVWAARRPDGSLLAFRPLGDGSLSGADDAAVELADDAEVQLAHPLLLPDDAPAAWQRHLADYEIAPLFDQMGRPPRRLPEAARGARALDAFLGHVVRAFKLRAAATRLGYARGPVGDGPTFSEYLRVFPASRLHVTLEFSGNVMPEEDREVALHTLSFARGASGEGAQLALSLAEVPPVLLSECWNDLATIAAGGRGFDAGWADIHP